MAGEKIQKLAIKPWPKHIYILLKNPYPMADDEPFIYAEFRRREVGRMLREMRPEFFHKGSCNDSGLATFFLQRGESRKKQKAFDICAGCPVKRDCHDYAIDNNIEYGIWAGTGAEQRRGWLSHEITPEEAWKIRTKQDWK